MTQYCRFCHCGAVQFEIDTEITELTMCDCSLCSKKNALMGIAHEDSFKLVAGEDMLSLYQWNTGVGRHYFCSVCGIYPVHRKRSMPDHGINVRRLDGFDPAKVPLRRADGSTMSVADPNPRQAQSASGLDRPARIIIR